jgi:mannosyltransferase
MALRSISLVASAGAAFLIYRIARRWFDVQASMIAVVIFVSSANTSFAAADARPYALASVMSLGALLFAMRWTERNRARDALMTGVLTATTIYVHYLFALVVPLQLLYLVFRYREGWRPPRKHAVAATLVLLALVAPTLPQIFDLIRRRGTLSFAARPSVVDLLRVVGLPLALLLAGLVLRRIGDRGRAGAADAPKDHVLPFIVTWSLLAPLTLLVLSWLSSAELFVPRYFLVAVGGTAMLGAWAIKNFHPSVMRFAVVLALAAASIATITHPSHTDEDWRSAARAVALDSAGGRSAVVLLWSGLIEARQPSFLDDPKRKGFLLSPAVAYSFSRPVLALPYDLRPDVQGYLTRLLQQVRAAQTVYIVTSRIPEPFIRWFSEHVPRTAFTEHLLGRFGKIEVTALRRRP